MKVYVLIIWNTDIAEIVGVFKTYDLANNLAVTLPCSMYEIQEFELNAI